MRSIFALTALLVGCSGATEEPVGTGGSSESGGAEQTGGESTSGGASSGGRSAGGAVTTAGGARSGGAASSGGATTALSGGAASGGATVSDGGATISGGAPGMCSDSACEFGAGNKSYYCGGDPSAPTCLACSPGWCNCSTSQNYEAGGPNGEACEVSAFEFGSGRDCGTICEVCVPNPGTCT